jgi:hypothetical protein
VQHRIGRQSIIFLSIPSGGLESRDRDRRRAGIMATLERLLFLAPGMETRAAWRFEFASG